VRLTRVHVEVALAPHSRLTLEGTAANHITKVLRLRAGAALTLFDGRGGEYAAHITELRRDTVLVETGEHRDVERESPLAITLLQGISRGERMDWVVQKATELGVKRLVPVATERTVVRLDERQAANRVRHWRAIAIAACEQCGRNRVPEVDDPVSFDVLPEVLPQRGLRVVLAPDGALRVQDLLPAEGVAVLIGPEGGLTEAEHGRALDSGFLAMRLGPRVLRTETAAIAALAAMQLQSGDL
jgi:16S rRNA (uracil1498-N3)-methyltransferase